VRQRSRAERRGAPNLDGIVNRLEAINASLARKGRRRSSYLEIGVQRGEVFRKVRARVRIGVDPRFLGPDMRIRSHLGPMRERLGLRGGAFLFSCTSDEFFEARHRVLGRRPLDCVLVDGLHSADQAYRDVLNSLEHLADDGVIVMHDCSPASAVAALPTLGEAARHPEFIGAWNGDVWKALVRLRATHPDLQICVLDCDEGVGLIRRGGRGSEVTLSEADLHALTYEDLDADREGLLNLQPPEHLTRFLSRAD